MTRAWLSVPGIQRASADDLEALERIATQGDFDPDEMATIISVESGWKPDSHNSIKAGGLIGFLPSTLEKLGWTKGPEAFWQLSIGEQLPWVERFYAPFAHRIHRRGDLYMATFWPEGVGKPDDEVIAAADGPHVKVWEQNPGLRSPGNGPITVGSVRNVLAGAMARAELRPRTVPGGKSGGNLSAHNPGGALLVLVAGYFAVRWLMRRRARREG